MRTSAWYKTNNVLCIILLNLYSSVCGCFHDGSTNIWPETCKKNFEVTCHYEELWAKLGPINVLSCVDKAAALVWILSWLIDYNRSIPQFIFFSQEKAQEFTDDFLPEWLKPLEKLLEDGKGDWYSGGSTTFADFAIMVILDFIHRDYMTFKGLNNLEERRKILNKFPMVKANYERTSSLPAVKSWKEKKPEFLGL